MELSNCWTKLKPIQKTAVIYGCILLVVASLRLFPFLADAHGATFGLFHLDWLDDVLHTTSGLWGVAAGFLSVKQTKTYFRYFGLIYFIDSLIGLVYGQNPLHIGFWTGEALHSGASRIAVNIPHFILGAFALWKSK